MKKLAKAIRHEARKKRIEVCHKGYKALREAETMPELADVLFQYVDFVITYGIPSLATIEQALTIEEQREAGLFICYDKPLASIQRALMVDCDTDITYQGADASTLFAISSTLEIEARGRAFVMVDAFALSVINIVAKEEARVVVNYYHAGQTIPPHLVKLTEGRAGQVTINHIPRNNY